jgi:3',5'-cyclic AMP phosphodiesterase CpdA
LNKRATGYLNWKLNRARNLERGTLVRLIDHMKERRPELTAVTGDLVNLSLGEEFANAARWLESVGPPEKVCAIPGNHDAYVPGALDNARRAWGKYMHGETVDDSPFPYVRRVGDVAVIACSSAVATPPFIAAGRFDNAQALRLRTCLRLLGEAGLFRVVLIHHAPNKELGSRIYGLWGADRFRAAIKEQGAELILHGHTHTSSIYSVPGAGRDVPVIGVASASAQNDSTSHPARYNLFSIERRSPAGWSCVLKEYGYQRLGEDIVLRLEMRIT